MGVALLVEVARDVMFYRVGVVAGEPGFAGDWTSQIALTGWVGVDMENDTSPVAPSCTSPAPLTTADISSIFATNRLFLFSCSC